jgi:hypothetical protein
MNAVRSGIQRIGYADNDTYAFLAFYMRVLLASQQIISHSARAWKFSINPEPIRINARVLPPVSLQFRMHVLGRLSQGLSDH